MNRTAINNFAVWARREMRAKVSQRAAKYGITEENHGSTAEDSVNGVLLSRIELRERNALIEEIEKKGYKEVMDEVAYTWFNRFIALRFMEVNGYLPTMIRVFTDENNNFRPQILTEAINIEMDGLNMERVYEYKKKNDNEGLYKYLIITQCNALSTPLPQMFQRINDYTELLFPDYLLREGSVIEQMIKLIPEDDWREQVQIIGWLYQYYISERKDEVSKAKSNGKKVSVEDIPAVTQLFTPDWIVRYLVDNSLGRLWMLNHPNSKLTEHMSYYIKPCDNESDFIKLQSPEEIKLCDPCCGSGHMLTYAFDLLSEIYSECGYTTKDTVEHIIKDNLYGIELDNRAGQLAYFALMMKAREKSRRFFSSGIQPNVCVLHNITFREDEMAEATSLFNKKNDLLITNLLSQYEHADTLGSLISPIIDDIDSLKAMLKTDTTGDLFFNPNDSVYLRVQYVLKFSEFLSKRYHVVVTNPPYLDPSYCNSILSEFAKKEYPNSKTDAGTMFIERNLKLSFSHGYVAMVTLNGWMTVSSFKFLRKNILNQNTILSLLHIGKRGFDSISGDIVSTVAFVLSNSHYKKYQTDYFDISKYLNEQTKQNAFLNSLKNSENHYIRDADYFSKIQDTPIAYWLSETIINDLNIGEKITEFIDTFQGIITGNNEKFLRLWFEVSAIRIPFSSKIMENIKLNEQYWIPYNKGGESRKWYGIQDYVINWRNGAKDKTRGKEGFSDYYLREYVAWSYTVSDTIATRYYPYGFLWDVRGSGIMDKSNSLYYLEALISSKVGYSLFRITNLSPSCQVENIMKLPIIMDNISKPLIDNIVKENNILSKTNWDSFETSWDFKRSPLLDPLTEPSYEEQVEMDNVTFRVMGYLGSDKADEVFYANRPIRKACPLESAYVRYQAQANEDFYHLKMNEEELNRIFIDIYGLADELKPEEDEKMVSIHRIYDSEDEIPEGMKKSQYALTKKDVIKNFISYAVGCMFGRYSLDMDGLAYAGGEWNESKYTSFIPDKDNIIPITEEEYFSDDIVSRFVEFVKVCYGESSLEENLKFVADALEGKGTPRDVLRQYFLNDFYKDHLKMYQKRPIYWLFDSGKKNGFKALIYMHRYQRDTSARVRTDYVHEIQSRYRAALEEIAKRKESASSTTEKVKLEKKEAELKAKAEEVRIYEEKIHHLADEMIAIDLDDGVKVNYAFFKDVLSPVK